MPFCNLSQLFIVDIKKYIIIFVFFFSNIIKSEVIQFTKDSNKYDITSNIWVALVEKTDDFKIEYLSSLSDDSFNKNSNRYLEKEFNGKDLLIKFKIISNINKKYFLQINDPLIDYIDILVYSKEKSYNYKSGWLVPINLRPIKDRKHIFELPSINIDQEFDIYIKLRKEDNISLNLEVLTEEALWQENRDNNLILGSYYGLIFIIFIIYLIVYLGSKDLKYLQTSLFIFSALFMQLCMHGTFSTFFDQDMMLNKKLYLSSAYIFYMILFYSIYKSVNNNEINNIFYYIILISFPLLFIILNGNYFLSINIIRYIGLLDFLILFYLFFKNYESKEKLKELVIWTPIVIGIFIAFLRYKGLVNSDFITVNIFEVSNAIQILVLSFLAQIRMSAPQKENILQKELLESYYKQRDESYQKITEGEERSKLILQELKLASDIQRGLIPVPEKIYPIIKVKYYYEYLMQVGGDFFDIVNVDDNSMAVFIADASGHGIPAALLSTMYKMSFANAISRYSNPSAIFKDVNVQTKKVLDTHDYLTAFLMVVQSTGEISYSSAAHRPPFLYRKSKNTGEILFAKGLFLGMSSNMDIPYEEKNDILEKGDRLLFYTDGIFDESIKDTWNPETLLYIFTKSANLSIDAALDHIVLEWKKRIGVNKIKDDATFLLIEYHGKTL
jgi:serine phosphatase RsbU (regulator of sigma subunit)